MPLAHRWGWCRERYDREDCEGKSRYVLLGIDCTITAILYRLNCHDHPGWTHNCGCNQGSASAALAGILKPQKPPIGSPSLSLGRHFATLNTSLPPRMICEDLPQLEIFTIPSNAGRPMDYSAFYLESPSVKLVKTRA